MEDELNTRANILKEVIRKTPYDLLQERVYTCTANGCLLLTAFKQKKGKKGWSRFLVDDVNQPMLTSSQQTMIENAFEKAPWILEFLNSSKEETRDLGEKAPETLNDEEDLEMVGGSMESPGLLPKLELSGSLFVKPDSLPNSTDFSLDEMLKKFLKRTEELDTYWAKVAETTNGFTKLSNGTVQIPFLQKEISTLSLVNFLVLLIDSVRLSAGLSGESSTALSILVLLEELITGQWRQMILTSLAFISPTGMAAGILFKYIVNVWVRIAPQIRDDILKDVLKGIKSVFLSFLLWAATALPPQVVREQIESSILKTRTMIDNLDMKVKELEEKGSLALKPLGKRLEFTKLNLNSFKTLSMTDLQNLQALAQWDLLVCTSEFQSILKPLLKNPILHLVIELFNIPTLPEDTYKMCGTEEFKPIVEKLSIALEPEIVEDNQNPPSNIVPEPTPAPEPATIQDITQQPAPVPVPKKKPSQRGGVLKLRPKSTKGRKHTPRRSTRRL